MSRKKNSMKVFCSTYSDLYSGMYYCKSTLCWLFLRLFCLSRRSRLEVFNKVMHATGTLNFLYLLKYLAFRKWRQVVHHWWTGAHHVCVSTENWGQLEFPRVLCLNFPLTEIISICPTFSPLITPTGKHCK
jgi:hypothetical protein